MKRSIYEGRQILLTKVALFFVSPTDFLLIALSLDCRWNTNALLESLLSDVSQHFTSIQNEVDSLKKSFFFGYSKHLPPPKKKNLKTWTLLQFSRKNSRVYKCKCVCQFKHVPLSEAEVTLVNRL